MTVFFVENVEVFLQNPKLRSRFWWPNFAKLVTSEGVVAINTPTLHCKSAGIWKREKLNFGGVLDLTGVLSQVEICIWLRRGYYFLYLAVHNSSIGVLVTHSE